MEQTIKTLLAEWQIACSLSGYKGTIDNNNLIV